MADFEVDLEAFKTAKAEYIKATSDMKNVKTKLSNAINQLKNVGWESDAGKKFYEFYEKDWGETIDKYTKVIEFMCTLLNEAETQYRIVENERKKLKF